MTEQITPRTARRIALAAQGFGRTSPAAPGRKHVRDLVRKLGVVQIDSVNVLTRSQYLPFFALGMLLWMRREAWRRISPAALWVSTLLFAVLLVYWVRHPGRRWMSWTMGIAFSLVLALPLLGLLVTPR